ncbi:cyclin-T1-5-like isoform X2 [Cornus florida]|uniref:cyclin-T1-5-like isoform X2 n=1 Tax=Cornus florida TaxID=4283 RepID=UPI00289FCB51|nr:cyclin-T1-5-like isoform X2 [Cornus florida]
MVLSEEGIRRGFPFKNRWHQFKERDLFAQIILHVLAGFRHEAESIIATVCMFLAGKVEETPRPLKDVIVVSYEIIHKKDPAAAQRIKQKDVYEQQKELILLGERLVLATLGFDLNVHHPYKPLVEAIKKFKVAQNALAQVAWNFVNDGLRTSLCLQFKSHHIAAGAIFLAAKFLKVKLPSDGEKVWWQEFDVTPRQLEEVSNQMLELYEQNRVPISQGSEVEGSITVGSNHRASEKSTADDEEQLPTNGRAQLVGAGAGAVSTVKSGHSKQFSSLPATDHAHADNYSMPSRSSQNESNENGSTEMGSVITDHKVDGEIKDKEHSEKVNMREGPNKSKSGSERTVGEDRGRNGGTKETTEAGEWGDNGALQKSRNMQFREGPLGQSPQDAIKMIDKVKAALEKRKKSRVDHWKRELMNEDDMIEKELEEGIELAAEDEKNRQERRQSWSKTENEHHEDVGGGKYLGMKGQSSRAEEVEDVEEEEMVDDALPILNNHKRRGSPLDRQLEAKRRHD